MNSSTVETVTIFTPKRIDLCTAPFLEKDLEAKIQPGATVIIDFTRTLSIDPASANVIMEGFFKSRQRQAKLSLKGINSQVKVVLEMAGVLQHFRRKPLT